MVALLKEVEKGQFGRKMGIYFGYAEIEVLVGHQSGNIWRSVLNAGKGGRIRTNRYLFRYMLYQTTVKPKELKY
jgi:hypothetical protein